MNDDTFYTLSLIGAFCVGWAFAKIRSRIYRNRNHKLKGQRTVLKKEPVKAYKPSYTLRKDGSGGLTQKIKAYRNSIR